MFSLPWQKPEVLENASDLKKKKKRSVKEKEGKGGGDGLAI